MEQKFINLFVETVGVEGREIFMSDEFREFEEWDSLALLSVIAMIDEEYDLIIESNDFQNLKTVGDIYNYLTSKSN
jgi:acyl carrier protein